MAEKTKLGLATTPDPQDESRKTSCDEIRAEKPSSNQETRTKKNLRFWGATNETKQDAD
jgi:hypothetical protein